jgi:REP element-mobilizing transposase RayT
MREVCADFGAELREFNGEADHMHLLVHYPPRVALSRLVGSLKGVSARRLRPPRRLPSEGAAAAGYRVRVAAARSPRLVRRAGSRWGRRRGRHRRVRATRRHDR